MIQLIGLIVAIVANLFTGPAAHVNGAPEGVSGGGPVGRPIPHPQPICEPPAAELIQSRRSFDKVS